MRSVLSGFTLLLVAGIACHADPLGPSSETLAGHWSRAPESLTPNGQYLQTLEFTVDGHYVLTGAFRGYAQLPADFVGSTSREYGTYVLHSDTLRFAQDSVRSWDYLSGTYFYAGPKRYEERPDTDSEVELTNTRLTLRYSVDHGDGRYMPVKHVYDRDS